VYTLRYPGNAGRSGIYHFTLQSGVINPYKDGKAPFFVSSNNFPAMAAFFDTFAARLSAWITAATWTAAEGASRPRRRWVAYANGDPSSEQPLGKDSKGNDWKTVGYWASLRAAAP